MERYTGGVLAVVAAGLAVFFAFLPAQIVRLPWAPSFGIELAFVVDGLSRLFAVLITGIGALVFLYSTAYMAGKEKAGRFHFYLLFFMISMLGVVLSGNLLLTYVFWELTSFWSFVLIGFDHDKTEAREAAVQAWVITGLGGLAMLAGFVMIGTAAGTYDIRALIDSRDALQQNALYAPAVLLIFLGAFTKSAQFPFHVWLPAAMEAPTPVSAYLHSATMVKAGIFLLARLHPALAGTDIWYWPVLVIGSATAFAGALFSFFETDLKRILAYATVSALGVSVLLLAFDREAAVTASVVWLIAHAFYKGALFMVAGILDHEAGSRDLQAVGGLGTSMPAVAVTGVVATASMAGIPPLFGFIAKEEVLTWSLDHVGFLWLPVLLAATAALLVVAAGNAGIRPFTGTKRHESDHLHAPPVHFWVGPAILAALGAVFGLAPGLLGGSFVAPAVSAVLRAPAAVDLKLWHGFNVPLVVSMVSIGSGILLYLFWTTLQARGAGAIPGARTYDAIIAGLHSASHAISGIIQSGYLPRYVATVFAGTILIVGFPLFRHRFAALIAPITDIRPYEAILCSAIVAAALSALASRRFFSAVTSLSIVGLGVALLFAFFGAPDLAMTQFAVETLTVIVFVLVLLRVRESSDFGPPQNRFRHAAIAITGGLVMSTLVLLAMSFEASRDVSDAYLRLSKPEAHGANVVNVILVDFRALDTLGETTVLATAAAGVYALLRLRKEETH